MTSDILARSAKEKAKQYNQSKIGLTKNMYKNQRESSRRRGHPEPEYSLSELREWVFSQPNFDSLYLDWVNSSFVRKKRPSCDRIDDYDHYRLENLQLTTYEANVSRSHIDVKSGKNTKQCKAVLQLTREGIVISEYHSARHAARVTGASQGSLSSCCRGERMTTGGFVWCFA